MRKIFSLLFILTLIVIPLTNVSARTPATGLPKFNGYSPREFALGGSQHWNIVKNLTVGDPTQMSQQYIPNTTGCVYANSGSSTSITATSSGTARCYLFQTVTSVMKPNTYYAFGATFSNITGSFTASNVSISGTVAEGGGSFAKTANGRYVIMFKTPSAITGTLQVRVGPGVAVDETWVASDSITISEPFLYEIASADAPPNEFVFGTAVLPYPNTNSTTSNTVTNGATTTQFSVPSKRGDSVLIIGDSFCNDSTDYAEQLKVVANRAIYYNCVSGATLSDEYTQFTDWLSNPNIPKSYYQRPKTVIFGGVINNIQADHTLATIQSQTMNLASLAKANGMIPVFLGPTPFGTASSWTQPRQDVLDSYRTWIRASSTQLFSVDPYNALKSPTSTVNLVQGGVFGTSGDGLHPVSGGMNFLAVLIENLGLKMIDRLSN